MRAAGNWQVRTCVAGLLRRLVLAACDSPGLWKRQWRWCWMQMWGMCWRGFALANATPQQPNPTPKPTTALKVHCVTFAWCGQTSLPNSTFQSLGDRSRLKINQHRRRCTRSPVLGAAGHRSSLAWSGGGGRIFHSSLVGQIKKLNGPHMDCGP